MLSTNTIQSMGIIKEKNGRYIFPLPKQNIAYVIPQDKLQLLFLLKNRLSIVLVATVFFYALDLGLYIDAAFLIGLGILAELYYRKIFLGKLTKLTNYSIAPVRLKAPSSLTSKILSGSLYIVFAGVVIFLSFTKYAYTSDRYLYILAAAVILFRGYRQIISKK